MKTIEELAKDAMLEYAKTFCLGKQRRRDLTGVILAAIRTAIEQDRAATRAVLADIREHIAMERPITAVGAICDELARLTPAPRGAAMKIERMVGSGVEM